MALGALFTCGLILNSFAFRLHGKPITANQMDDLLKTSKDLAERQAVWEASKQSGPALKPGLVQLQKLRNSVAQELGYSDYFSLQVAGFGMTMRDRQRAYFYQQLDRHFPGLRAQYEQRYGERYRIAPALWQIASI